MRFQHVERNFLTLLFVPLLLFSGCSRQAAQGEEALTVWHWMSDREEAFLTLAERYESLSGQRIRFELYAPSEQYSQKVKAAAQTNTLPDIFGVLGESRDLVSFIKSGHVAELGEITGNPGALLWRDTLFEKAVEVNEYKPGNAYSVPPGIYGVPLDVTTIQMLYNKRLLARAGLDPDHPPATWEEFVRAAAKLKEHNIPVFVSGFGETWMIEALATSFAINIMGEAKVYDTFRGRVPYTDPDWIRVLDVFKTLAEEDILIDGAVTMVNKTAEQTFANERSAFAFNGSWSVNVYWGMNPQLDYGVMLPPLVTNVHPMKVWGGAGSSLMVNARSPRKHAAFSFLQWLSEAEQQTYLAKATNNLPSNRVSLKHIPPILAQFADDIDNTVHPNSYPVREHRQVLEMWLKGIQSILIGEATPEEIAEGVQELKDRLKARGVIKPMTDVRPT